MVEVCILESGEKLINLKEIEGRVSPHHDGLDRALKVRAEGFSHLDDVLGMVIFLGGKIEVLGRREDWAVSKEIFPGVKAYFIFYRADEEFPATLKVLFSGDKLNLMSGEDLCGIIIFYVNHMLRYVRLSNPGKKLPEVCYRV